MKHKFDHIVPGRMYFPNDSSEVIAKIFEIPLYFRIQTPCIEKVLSKSCSIDKLNTLRVAYLVRIFGYSHRKFSFDNFKICSVQWLKNYFHDVHPSWEILGSGVFAS